MAGKLTKPSSGITFTAHAESSVYSVGSCTVNTAESFQDNQLVFINEKFAGAAIEAALTAAKMSLDFCICSDVFFKTIPNTATQTSQPRSYTATLVDKEQAHFQTISSGSSGTARRIRRSHESWIKSFRINRQLLQLSPRDSYAIIGKLSHSLPLYATLEALHTGADLHFIDQQRPQRQLRSLQKLQISVLYLTPSQARLLCNASDPELNTIGFAVRIIMCGGGKLDQDTRKALASLFTQAIILEFYGAAETSFITISDANTPAQSVGKPYPDVNIRITDEHGIATEGTGEIWINSPYLFASYASGPLRDTRWENGYVSIGEMGHMAADGYLYLSGRKSRMANIADKSVFLQDIEQLIIEHTETTQCVVLTIPDTLRGEALVAVLEGPESNSLRTSVLARIRQAIGATLTPKQIIFIDKLPMLAAGKPDIQGLQARVGLL